MATFKLCIGEPKTGKTYQKEVKDDAARQFMGLNIGESVKGDDFGMAGYELLITGGSDYCGFPMRRGILGQRKKIIILGGVGFSGAGKGIKKSKTVCGHKIHERISQINLKVTKAGTKNISELFGSKEEGKAKAGSEGEKKAKPDEKKDKPEEKKDKPEEKKDKTREKPKSEEKSEPKDKPKETKPKEQKPKAEKDKK